MQDIVLDESAGYADVRAGDAQARIDLFETNDRIADLHREHQGKPAAEYARALQDLVESLGLPRVSVFAAGQFVRAVVGACEDLKKKASPPAASPASTGSTPSAPAP